MARAPSVVPAMCWWALSGDEDGRAVSSLRQRIVDYYCAPLTDVFDGPRGTALKEIDRKRAIALLIGPVIIGPFICGSDFDYAGCARESVDNFLRRRRQ